MLRGNRLELGAEALLDRVAQQRVELVLEQLVGALARSNEQLGVLWQAGDPEGGKPALAGAEHVAGAAQLEVDLREAKAVALVRDGLEPRQVRIAEEDA